MSCPMTYFNQPCMPTKTGGPPVGLAPPPRASAYMIKQVKLDLKNDIVKQTDEVRHLGIRPVEAIESPAPL